MKPLLLLTTFLLTLNAGGADFSARIFGLAEIHSSDEQHYAWGLGGRYYFADHIGVGSSLHWFDTTNDEAIDNLQLEAVGRWGERFTFPVGVGRTFEDENNYAYAGVEVHFLRYAYAGWAAHQEEKEGFKNALTAGLNWRF